MDDQLKLTCVLAHPDDESMGTGGMLAKYADQGIETSLVTATGGEKGWFGPEDEYPGPQKLAEIRGKELQAAAGVLGLKEVHMLGFVDGELDKADPDEVIAKIVAHLRRFRPQVVVTFDPFGAYGHPDHIAISQLTTAAIFNAADPDYGEGEVHRVSKLYYMVETKKALTAFEDAFGDLVMKIDGQERRPVGWPLWSITTRVDSSEHWQRMRDAIFCHESQVVGYQSLMELPEEKLKDLWSRQHYYRAMSLVNGGGEVEEDLFAGLR